MNFFLKYLSTAPVILSFWLSTTSVFLIFVNFVYPDALSFPSF